MVLELVHLNIIPGKETEYEAVLSEAWKVIARAPGFVDFECKRCVERPGHYTLHITWETLDAHMEGFRHSPDFNVWRSMVQKFYDGPASVEHFRKVLLS